MKFPFRCFRICPARVLVLCAVLLTVHAYANAQADALPSWNDGPAKHAVPAPGGGGIVAQRCLLSSMPK